MPESASDQTYLKLQTVIEFETYDEQWQFVLGGCGHDDHAALIGDSGDLMVSAVPGGGVTRPLASSSAGEDGVYHFPAPHVAPGTRSHSAWR